MNIIKYIVEKEQATLIPPVLASDAKCKKCGKNITFLRKWEIPPFKRVQYTLYEAINPLSRAMIGRNETAGSIEKITKNPIYESKLAKIIDSYTDTRYFLRKKITGGHKPIIYWAKFILRDDKIKFVLSSKKNYYFLGKYIYNDGFGNRLYRLPLEHKFSGQKLSHDFFNSEDTIPIKSIEK